MIVSNGGVTLSQVPTARERELLRRAQLFDGGFATKCRAFSSGVFTIEELYRQPAAGIFDLLAAVTGKPPVEIIGAAGIKRPIRAAKDIDLPSAKFLAGLFQRAGLLGRGLPTATSSGRGSRR